MDVSEWLNVEGYLVTIDIEKHSTLLITLFYKQLWKAFGFGKYFWHWIEILLTD